MRRIKKGSAILLAAALVFSALALPKAYAAVGVDTDRTDCKITINVPTEGFSELDDLSIPVELYKVADIGVGAEYTLTTDFDTANLKGIENVNSTTSTEAWTTFAEEAKKIVDDRKEAENALAAAKTGTINSGTVTIEGIPVGLYLVDVQTTPSTTYEYSFTPYLISLPNNYYEEGKDTSDEWVYELTGSNALGLKPEKADRYGDLEINKTLGTYNATVGGATFVFQVEAKKTDVDTEETKVVYSNVVSLTFDGPGTKRVLIEDLPAGAVVTVTEIYSGAGYTLTSEGTQSVTIVAKGENSEVTADAEPVEVSFSNTYDEGMNGGSGVVNSFSYVDGQWTWQQKKVSDNENAKPNLAPVVSGTQQ